MQSPKKRIIDLFSGCGGLSLGFRLAGYESVLAIDNWQDALDTYEHNEPGCRVLCADISKLDPSLVKEQYKLHDIDVIVGGPPCQGFSIAGKRILEDARNELYKAFVGFVKGISPKAFVMENVPNILSIGGGIVRDSIVNDFRNLGYSTTYQVINASDFGVPQNRKRVFFVGIRGEGKFSFPANTIQRKVTTWEALSDLPEQSVSFGGAYTCNPLSDYQRAMRRHSATLNNHDCTVHTEKTTKIIAMVPDGGNYKSLPQALWGLRKVNIAWTRMNSSEPCFTIDTGHNHHFHYAYNRVPTVRESARIQSFCDDYLFLGKKGSQLKQVGNAVPPLVANAIATQLLNYI